MSYQLSSRHVLCSLLWILLFLGPLLFVPLAFAQEQITIPCEVMEVSKPFSTSSSKLAGISYILLHHAHSEDREVLSKWLKTYSGTEVTFIVNQKEHKGVLFRLAHCFGRGLLIYEGDAKPGRRAIIKVILSPPP